MNVGKTEGLIGFLLIAFIFLAAIPAYSAALGKDALSPGDIPLSGNPATPTSIPPGLLDSDDFEAEDDESSTLEDTPVDIDVLANDEGVDGEINSLTIDSEPDNGSATVQSDLTITYFPDAGFIGEDEFEYEVCIQEGDDDGDDENCDKADVLVLVVPAPAENNKPVAADDIYFVEQDSPLSILAPGVLANDSDPDGDALTALLLVGVTNGDLELNPDGSFNYTPAAGFIGIDTFSYQAGDGGQLSDPGSVEIEVIDTEPPSVHWLSPGSDGEVIEVGYEMVHLEVVASDNGTIDKVHFFRWDAQNEVFVDIAEVTGPPFAVQFHSSVLNYEWNQILARVYDTAGNISERVFIWVYQTVNPTKIYLPNVIR